MFKYFGFGVPFSASDTVVSTNKDRLSKLGHHLLAQSTETGVDGKYPAVQVQEAHPTPPSHCSLESITPFPQMGRQAKVWGTVGS